MAAPSPALGHTFFLDPQLLVVVIPCMSDGALHKTAFLIPSADIPGITTASSDRGDPGYQGSFRLDPPAEKMRPFAVPTEELGATILERLFPGRHGSATSLPEVAIGRAKIGPFYITFCAAGPDTLDGM